MSPFPSPPPLSFCLLSLPPFFLLCMLQLIVWTQNALMAFSQRAPISAALKENGAQWWSVGIFQKLLSHAAISLPPPLLLFFPYSPPPSSHPSLLQSSLVLWWDVRTEDGGKTIDRVSILSGEMLQRDKANVGRERPRSLLHFSHSTLVAKHKLQTHVLNISGRTGAKKRHQTVSFSGFLWKTGD